MRRRYLLRLKINLTTLKRIETLMREIRHPPPLNRHYHSLLILITLQVPLTPETHYTREITVIYYYDITPHLLYPRFGSN